MNTPDSGAKKGTSKNPTTTTTPKRLPARNSKGQFMRTPTSQPAAAANPPTAPRKTARSKKVAVEVEAEAEASDDDDEDPEDIDTPSKNKVSKAPAKAATVVAEASDNEDVEGSEEVETPSKKKVVKTPGRAAKKASASRVRKRVPKKFGGRAAPLRDKNGRFMRDPNKVEKAVEGKGVPGKKGKPSKKVAEEVEETDGEEVVVKTPAKKGKSSKKVVEEVQESEREEVVKKPAKRGRPKKVPVEVAEEESGGEEVVKTPAKRGRPKKIPVEEESDAEQVIKTPAKRGRPRKIPVEVAAEEEPDEEQDAAKAPVQKVKKVLKKKTTAAADEAGDASAEEESSKKDTGNNATNSDPKEVVSHDQAAGLKKSTQKKKKNVAFEVESDDDKEDIPAQTRPAAKADDTCIALEMNSKGLTVSISSKNPEIQLTTAGSSILDLAPGSEAGTEAVSPPRFATPESMECSDKDVAQSASPAIAPKTRTGRKRSHSLTSESEESAPAAKKARRENSAEPAIMKSIFG